MNISRLLFALLAATAATMTGYSEVTTDYYNSLDGLKGAELKTAVYQLARQKFSIQYAISTTYTNLRDTFKETDCRTIDGEEYWWDMYSTILNPITKSFSDCSYQREHAFPKSWWAIDNNNVTYTTAYCDMHHLYPSNGSANGSKSNWPLGEVGNATFDNGAVKTGTPVSGLIYGVASPSKVFEPADEYKGDFARAYMYVATIYQDLEWSTSCPWMVERNAYPTFTTWAREMLCRWSRADKVSEKETNRNNAVERLQHNRNPFIDLPNLFEYIWGDSINRNLDIATTVKSYKATSGGGTDPNAEVEFYAATFTGGNSGNCTVENDPSLSFNVWVSDNSYGWKGTGYNGGSANAADARLVTPDIDLTNATEAKLTFSHAINYSGPEYMSVYVRKADGTETDITSGLTWPLSQSWTFISAGNYDMSSFLGQKVKIVFRYTSTATTAGTWEIKNMSVKGKRSTSGINLIESGDAEGEAVYYSIDGRVIDPTTYKGLVIKRQGSKVSKLLLR